MQCGQVTSPSVDESNQEEGTGAAPNTGDDDIENLYLGDRWKWNNWEPNNFDDKIEGPTEHDHYSGPHE